LSASRNRSGLYSPDFSKRSDSRRQTRPKSLVRLLRAARSLSSVWTRCNCWQYQSSTQTTIPSSQEFTHSLSHSLSHSLLATCRACLTRGRDHHPRATPSRSLAAPMAWCLETQLVNQFQERKKEHSALPCVIIRRPLCRRVCPEAVSKLGVGSFALQQVGEYVVS
jgi:hypothetical protein